MKNILKINIKTILFTILLVDTCFIAIHIVHIVIDRVFPWYQGFLLNNNYALDQDGGYAEIFQYMKELVVVLMLGFLYWRRKAFIYLGWGILFLFLLIDDSLQIHENLGETANKLINITHLGGIRGQDIGEITAIAIMGAFLLSFVLVGYLRSPQPLRKFSNRLVFLLALLIAVGVLVDLVHFMFADSPIWFNFLTIVEDGGEMIAFSLILTYVYSHLQANPHNATPSLSPIDI